MGYINSLGAFIFLC